MSLRASYVPLSHERLASTGTADVKTSVRPANAAACYICAETTSARVTFDGTDPSAASAPSVVVPIATVPQLYLVGPGTTIKVCSTAAAASVLQIAWLQ